MANEKKNSIPIGIPGAPWATMIRKEEVVGQKTVTTYELGVLEESDNPLTLMSSRSYPEAMGTLYRGMPTRDMLPAFEAMVHHANPDQNNRVIFVASDPGFGKSYLAVLIGKARDPRGPIITDAGGKNLEYLLFRTVFDSEESKSLTQAVDKGLQENSLDPLSINALQKLGKHFSQEGGRRCIDWKGLVDDAEIKQEDIKQALEMVRSIERWDAKSLGIGFKVEKGPLVVAHEEGRDIVIDEMDKAKEGSETPLQLVLQVLNGEIPEHTVQLGSLGPFTFRRGNPGLVVFTGNLPKDGKASHLISESFDRRVPRFVIPAYGPGSWMDMTAKMLTGLPVPLLHEITPGEWKIKDPANPTEQKWAVKDPEGFTKKLFELSTLGMDDEDRRKLKEWQLNEVSNWENVLEASRKLGEFYHKWGQLVDPDSPLLKDAQFADVLMEVDDPQNPTLKITPSTMIRHVERALISGPQKKEAGKSGGFSSSFDWNNPIRATATKDPIEENIGTRLASEIMDEIYLTTAQAGKKNLYAQLLEDARQAGLVGSPPPIAQLLNVDPTKVKGSLSQAKREQNTHAALLRELFPDLGLSANDEDILPLRYVQSAIEQVEKQGRKEISPFTTELIVPNTDLDTVQQQLFNRVAADGRDSQETLQDTQKRLPPEKLLNRLSLLSSLTMLSVGEKNLDALWNKGLTGGGFAGDEATAIAQNQSKTGLAITTICCNNGEAAPEYETLHVLRNSKKGRTIIVGSDAIPDDLYNRLKRSNIVYISQKHFSARDRLNIELKDMINPEAGLDMCDAFLLRNNTTAERGKSLAGLLAEPDITTLKEPNFITTLDPAEVTHSKRAEQSAVKSRLFGSMLG